jgi:hypothetical protein
METQNFDLASVYKNTIKFLHPDTFFYANQAYAEELTKRFNNINSQLKNDKLSSKSKKYCEEFYREIEQIDLPNKVDILDTDEECYLSKIQSLLDKYEGPILRGEALETETIKSFKSAAEHVISIFDTWIQRSKDKDIKYILNTLRPILVSIESLGIQGGVTDTELINLKNIFQKGGDFLQEQLIKVASGNKTEEDLAENFLKQLFEKIAAALRKSDNPDIIKLKSALELLLVVFDSKKASPYTSTERTERSGSRSFEYGGYPTSAQINMSQNGVNLSLSNGVLRYYRVPVGASMNMINGRTKYYFRGKEVQPELISEEEAISLGVKKPVINSDGSVSIGSSRISSGGSVNIGGGSWSGVNFQSVNVGSSSESKPTENGRINEGIHVIDVSKIRNLERITGGVITIKGEGKFNLDRISGGVINIESGVTVSLDRISGGVVNIAVGARVIADRLTGGVINGKNRISYEKNTGAIVN